MTEARTPYEAEPGDEDAPARMLLTRTVRLLNQVDAAVAMGGKAFIHLRDSARWEVARVTDHGDGLLQAVAPDTQGEGSVWFYEDDIVAVETTGFQEPA